MQLTTISFSIAVFLGLSGLASPLFIAPSGAPVTWAKGSPVSYYVASNFRDLSNRQGLAAVEAAFRTWTAVPNNSLPTLRPGPEATDLIPQSFAEIETIPNRYPRSIFYLYDQNDTIARRLRVPPNTINGYSRVFDDERRSIQAAVVLLTRTGATSARNLDNTILHETGHALGLGHMLLHTSDELDAAIDSSATSVMFPAGTNRTTLHPSDRLWLAHLYRNGAEPSKEFGVIAGIVRVRAGDDGVSGVNVIAIATNSRDTEQRFSCLSGFDGRAGFFAIPVPPGTYQVIADSVPTGRLALGVDFTSDYGRIGPKLLRGDQAEIIPYYGGIDRQVLVNSLPVSGGTTVNVDFSLR
jgi:hypothetical protein